MWGVLCAPRGAGGRAGPPSHPGPLRLVFLPVRGATRLPGQQVTEQPLAPKRSGYRAPAAYRQAAPRAPRVRLCMEMTFLGGRQWE